MAHCTAAGATGQQPLHGIVLHAVPALAATVTADMGTRPRPTSHREAAEAAAAVVAGPLAAQGRNGR